MATFNTPIVTNQGLALLKSAIAGTDTITFTQTIYSADDYSQSTDTQVASLNDISSKDIVTPAKTIQNADGTIKVRSVGYNDKTTQAFNVKTYALYAQNKAGNVILFAVSTSQTADFVPANTGKQLSQIAYTFNFNVAQADNITFSDAHDVGLTYADLDDINAEIKALQNSIAHIDLSSAVKQANSYTDSSVSNLSSQLASSVASNSTNINNLASSVASNSSAIASNASGISSLSSATSQSISAVQSSVSANSSAISLIDATALQYQGIINENFDNITKTGIYQNESPEQIMGMPGNPDGSSGHGYLVVIRFTNNGIWQKYINDHQYQADRYQLNGWWTDWKIVANNHDINQLNANIAQAQSNAQSYADSKIQIFDTVAQAKSAAQSGNNNTLYIARGN